MFTPGLDDEILMIVPFILVPLQMYFITTINKQTPFIVKQSVSYVFVIRMQLKRFVRKYTLYVALLMSMQCLQVGVVVFGSRDPNFFNYDFDDGYSDIRHVSFVFLN